MLQKSGRRGRALRPCFCERNERRKKRRKTAGENVFHAGELVLPADAVSKAEMQAFSAGAIPCSAAKRRRVARTGRRGRGDKPEQPQDKKDSSPTKKKHPVRAGIRAGYFRRKAGRACLLDRASPEGGGQTPARRLCTAREAENVSCALPSGEALRPASGKSRTQGLV